MSALNGGSGKAPWLLTRLLGLGSTWRGGDSHYEITSDGAASVDLEKLSESDGFLNAIGLKAPDKVNGKQTAIEERVSHSRG